MPEIAAQRRGLPFPWQYLPPGTTASTLSLAEPSTLHYTLADPLLTPPGDDPLPADTRARQIVDPATYEGTLGPDIGASTFDAFNKCWVVLTYAGSRRLYLMPMEHLTDIDAWLTQPSKTLHTGTVVPSPYGTDEKQYAILAKCIKTFTIDWQET